MHYMHLREKKCHVKKVKMKLLMVAYSWGINYGDLIAHTYKILELKNLEIHPVQPRSSLPLSLGVLFICLGRNSSNKNK